MPKPLPYSDLEADERVATVKGDSAKALAQALISKPSETYAEMGAAFGVVRPADIAVNADGTISIHNPGIAKELSKRLAAGIDPSVAFLDTNCSCGGGGKT